MEEKRIRREKEEGGGVGEEEEVFLARICYGFVVRDVLYTEWPKSELADNSVVVILVAVHIHISHL